ncbi:dephospho-CoA kinase [Marinomonas sp. IMCC 4694]|uniref:dephospho-CoA kinase n=1 Tax=Marinomonas sp. IMCC 4694 TaxID=2605432 RepID=UPI0011E7DAAC|nr:dephospho-CoA kinase [Marinomonas sp. IMCC 4694]TYL47920.1 dephospho-CoA kinase [Marinomonas sp. IMCC 4694]
MTRRSPPIIGLTGGIGSGKSTVAKCFFELGIQNVDADDIARLVVLPGSECLHKIHQRHGDAILLNDGTLNRRGLRDIIFNQPEERAWLEALTHPAIRKGLLIQLDKATSKYVLLVHPLLFETKQNEICKQVIAIDVPAEIQLQRVMLRDNISEENAQKILSTQLSNKDRIRNADLSLKNSGNTDELNDKVFKLNEEILALTSF